MVNTKSHIIFAMLFAVIAANPVSPSLQAHDKTKEGFAATSAGVRLHYLQSGDVSSSRSSSSPAGVCPPILWKEQLAKFAEANRV